MDGAARSLLLDDGWVGSLISKMPLCVAFGTVLKSDLLMELEWAGKAFCGCGIPSFTTSLFSINPLRCIPHYLVVSPS